LGNQTLTNEDDKSHDGSSFSYINVPAQIHSTLSITNNMQHMSKLNDYDSSANFQHDYFNPLTSKALSNSNLNMLENPYHNLPQQNQMVHSAVNLLDLSNNESGGQINDFLQPVVPQVLPPPRRPPPPVPKLNPSQNQNNPIQEDFGNLVLVDFDTTTTTTSNNSNSNSNNNMSNAKFDLNFDDDFGKIEPTQLILTKNDFDKINLTLSMNNYDNKFVNPLVPPPLPPVPPVLPPLPAQIPIILNSCKLFCRF
jgi:hypothetical protein